MNYTVCEHWLDCPELWCDFKLPAINPPENPVEWQCADRGGEMVKLIPYEQKVG
jgi:hypothetical protein